MIRSKKKFAYYDICFVVCLLLAFPFLLWKCRYGYGAYDEPFYLTLAQRLAKGDALLSEEWNLSQLSGLLLLPFYRLHELFFGSTEGIILHFRYFYVIVQTLVSIFLYLMLRRFGYGGVFAVLLFLLFTPYDIMALSYNTMGLMGISLCLVLIACNDRKRPFVYGCAGFCYAIAVLCNPYLISLYILYLVPAVLFRGISAILDKRFPKKDAPADAEKRRLPLLPFLYFTIGAAIPAFCLLCFTFSRAGLHEVIANLSEILNDPEHASRSFYSVIYSYLYVMIHTFSHFLAAYAVILLIALTDRRKYQNAWIYFCMTALVTAIAVLIHIPSIQTDYNYIMFPAAACGLTAYLLTRKKNHIVFFWMWFTGILYTFCLSWASNQGENSICMGMPIVMIASVILIYKFLKESVSDFKRYTTPLVLCTASLLFLAQLGTECYAKSVHAFWEPSVDELDVSLTEGPLNGLLTTNEHAEAYRLLLSEIQGYRDCEEPVLFISSFPWCYLYAELDYGTYSSWISTFSASSGRNPAEILQERLSSYYRLHPDKIPSTVYIVKDDLWDFSYLSGQTECSLFSAADGSSVTALYSVTETEYGYHLTRISPE